MTARMLVVDIETAPNLGFHWGLWQQNIDAMSQLVTPGRMLCWGARWHGERRMHFASEWGDGRIGMLQGIHDLLDEADFVIGWNSARFDRRWINAELDKESIGIPSPARDIDLMKVAKAELYLPSYKLDYVAQKHYGLQGKVAHTGFRLWRDILMGTDEEKAKAQRLMKRYQLGDIRTTDDVFERMKPLIRILPNPALYSDDETPEACSRCHSDNLHRRGFFYTTVSAFPRWRCMDCGKWMRGAKRERGVSLRGI